MDLHAIENEIAMTLAQIAHAEALLVQAEPGTRAQAEIDWFISDSLAYVADLERRFSQLSNEQE